MRRQLTSKLDPVTQRERKKAFKVVAMQAVGTLLMALILLIWKDRNAAGATFLGGGASLVPTLLFTWCVFRLSKPGAAKQMAFTFYIGEFVKLLTTALLVAGSIIWLPQEMLAVLLGFIGAQLGFWLAPAVIRGA